MLNPLLLKHGLVKGFHLELCFDGNLFLLTVSGGNGLSRVVKSCPNSLISYLELGNALVHVSDAGAQFVRLL